MGFTLLAVPATLGSARSVGGMAKPKKRRREPNRTATRKPATTARAGSGPRPGPGTQRLRASTQALGKLLAGAPPDSLVPLLVPILWLHHVDGLPGNLCVDAAYTLRYAYAQFGIRAEIMPVDLVIQDSRTGATVMHGRPDPHWEDNQYVGHCVLRLPDDGRFVDATVEQYREISRLHLGPIVGRTVLSTGPVDAGRPVLAGTHFGVSRQHLMLLYTASGSEAAVDLASHPLIREGQPLYQRAGLNLASHALLALLDPAVIDRARQSPYPRLHALLDALTGRAHQITDDGDWYFLTPEPQRLDELTLPPSTPPIPL